VADAESINLRRRRRRDALVALYGLAEEQGFEHPRIDMGALADRVGVDDGEMGAIAQHLESLDYLEFVAMGGRGGLVMITEAGIAAAEEEIAGPDHGDLLEVITVTEQRALEAWMQQTRAAIDDGSIGGDEEFKAQVLSLLDAINATLKGPRPSRKLLRVVVRSLSAVMLTVGSMSPKLHQLVGSIPGLG